MYNKCNRDTNCLEFIFLPYLIFYDAILFLSNFLTTHILNSQTNNLGNKKKLERGRRQVVNFMQDGLVKITDGIFGLEIYALCENENNLIQPSTNWRLLAIAFRLLEV